MGHWDWADLPAELINLISNKLPDVTDFVRFRTVCKSWRSSVLPSDSPPQLPWLLECTVADAPDTLLQEGLRFYSLATSETGTLPVKEPLRCRRVSYHGPGSGYLLLFSVFNQNPVWMWNPLTNAHISLPVMPHLYKCSRVWTGSDPIISRSVIFVGKRSVMRECWAYHPSPGNTTWKVTKGCIYENCCYWDGMLFTTKGCRDTMVFDLTSQELVYEIPSPEHISVYARQHIYLAEISGVMMRVCMYLDYHQNVEDSIFCFYQLHFQGKNRTPSWVKVGDIGNHVLFLDLMSAFSMKPVAGLKGNCIYFMSCRGDTPCRYDIATGTFQRVPCPFEACTWFLPSLC